MKKYLVHLVTPWFDKTTTLQECHFVIWDCHQKNVERPYQLFKHNSQVILQNSSIFQFISFWKWVSEKILPKTDKKGCSLDHSVSKGLDSKKLAPTKGLRGPLWCFTKIFWQKQWCHELRNLMCGNWLSADDFCRV